MEGGWGGGDMDGVGRKGQLEGEEKGCIRLGIINDDVEARPD